METQFGPVGAEVLRQTDLRREVLVRAQSDQRVLEYAVVEFDAAGLAAYPEIHQRIRDGALIGEAFREAGIQFERDEQPPTLVKLSEDLRNTFETDASTGVRIEADILVGPEQVRYAHNSETYSPELVWPESSSSR